MNKLLILTVLASILHAEVLISDGKKFYRPTVFFYWKDLSLLKQRNNTYSIEQTQTRQIKDKMAFCITEYEIYDIVHFDCMKTFNTLRFYRTKPEGLLRKDILEFYNDMPLNEYEKREHIKKEARKAIPSYNNSYIKMKHTNEELYMYTPPK